MRISDWSSDVCSSDLLGHGFLPPGQAAQIGLAYTEVGAGQMRARQGFPRQRALGRPRRGFVATRKSANDGAGLAVQGSKPGAVARGLRLGRGTIAHGQVVQQFKIEWTVVVG